MKYLNLATITVALHRIYEGNTQEHRTGTPASGLIQNYFPIHKFITTPEQIQEGSNRRPDFTIESLNGNNKLVPHAFVEIKGLINSNFNNILDQLCDTILHTVDDHDGSFCVYIIAMKAGKIAFYEFYSCSSLLDDFNVPNYKGFIPLGQVIPYELYAKINRGVEVIEYLRHITKVNIPHTADTLRALGVESTERIGHPHIWTLLNQNHSDYVHNLFIHMGNKAAGQDIA